MSSNRDLNGYSNTLTIHGHQFSNGCDISLQGDNAENLNIDFSQYNCTDGVASVKVHQGIISGTIIVEVKRGNDITMV